MNALYSMPITEINSDNSFEASECIRMLMESIPDGYYVEEYIFPNGKQVIGIARLEDQADKSDKFVELCNRLPIKEGMEAYMDEEEKSISIVAYYGDLVSMYILRLLKRRTS